MQSGPSQLDGVRWAERHAQTAFITAVRVDHGNSERCDPGHRARRYEI